MPRVMVEMFVKEHLRADHVVGSELVVNRFGLATGLIKEGGDSVSGRVGELFGDDQPCMGLGRAKSCSSFLSMCKVSSSFLKEIFVEKQLVDKATIFTFLKIKLEFSYIPRNKYL